MLIRVIVVDNIFMVIAEVVMDLACLMTLL